MRSSIGCTRGCTSISASIDLFVHETFTWKLRKTMPATRGKHGESENNRNDEGKEEFAVVFFYTTHRQTHVLVPAVNDLFIRATASGRPLFHPAIGNTRILFARSQLDSDQSRSFVNALRLRCFTNVRARQLQSTVSLA